MKINVWVEERDTNEFSISEMNSTDSIITFSAIHFRGIFTDQLSPV